MPCCLLSAETPNPEGSVSTPPDAVSIVCSGKSSLGPNVEVRSQPKERHPTASSISFIRPFVKIPALERDGRSHCGNALGERGVRGDVGELSRKVRPRGDPQDAMMSHWSFCSWVGEDAVVCTYRVRWSRVFTCRSVAFRNAASKAHSGWNGRRECSQLRCSGSRHRSKACYELHTLSQALHVAKARTMSFGRVVGSTHVPEVLANPLLKPPSSGPTQLQLPCCSRKGEHSGQA